MNGPARVRTGVSILGITNLDLASRMERTPERWETLHAKPTQERARGTRRDRAIGAIRLAVIPAQIDAARIQCTEAEGAQ